MLRMLFGKMKVDWKKIKKLGKSRLKPLKEKKVIIKYVERKSIKPKSKIMSIMEQESSFF